MGHRRKREPALHLARAAAYEAGLELCLSFPQRPRVESNHVLSVRSREAASRGEGLVPLDGVEPPQSRFVVWTPGSAGRGVSAVSGVA